jgi:hypothetical protein
MGIIKSKSQFGEQSMFECSCGSHLIKLFKDDRTDGFPAYHSLQFWEFRGDTQYGLWGRIKLGLQILFGIEGKYPAYDVLIRDEEIDELIKAFEDLKK